MTYVLKYRYNRRKARWHTLEANDDKHALMERVKDLIRYKKQLCFRIEEHDDTNRILFTTAAK
jgi:hypothetical protein